MRDFRKIILLLIVALFFLLIYVMYMMKENEKVEIGKPMVAVSTFSLYDITKHISEETLEIINIIPFGVDPHSYEPTPKSMVDISKSALVLYSGAGLEPWTDGFAFDNRVVDMSKQIVLRELNENEHEHHDFHDHQCAHNKLDPHYWLDFSNMAIAAKLITKELIKISPSHELLYVTNRDKYLEMLEKLDADYKQSLSSCKLETLIVNHNAIGYLSHRYNFHVESLSGFSPEAEPSVKNMARLISHVKEHSVSTVFFETFVSDRAIKNIASEAHVSVDVLQPLGNITADEAQMNLSYRDMMYINLEKISKALECQ
ncbi:MAG: metal ABC transporter substrate-binding protein [Campylobacterota bacterium]|nr:metal ABC transporter substrate-binding protein [Campylobacterota bacterium]